MYSSNPRAPLMSACRNNALARASSLSSFASGRCAPLAVWRSTAAMALGLEAGRAVACVICALAGIGADAEGESGSVAAGGRLLWLGARPGGSREGAATTVEALHAA